MTIILPLMIGISSSARLTFSALICAAALLLPFAAGPAAAAEEQQGAGNEPQAVIENAGSGGCQARGTLYPQGAIIDLKALKGIQSLSVTPVLFACEDGVWISLSAQE